MAQEVVVTCAVTGSHQNFHKHPNFPITPKQIAASCLEARAAGAAVVHIHVRDPETGAARGDPELYREVVERIRDSGSDVLINLTTGWGGRYVPSAENPRQADDSVSTLTTPEIRVRHIEELRPDICSLDVGTMNFGPQVFMNTLDHLRVMAQHIKDAGVKPELEVFEPGHILLANQLIKEGLVETPTLFQFCLGILYSTPATPEAISFFKTLIPRDAKWAAFGISRWEFQTVAAAVHGGGYVRVGLEDNIYVNKGEFGTNGDLVEKAVKIIRDVGAEPVEPERAAELLELPQRGQSAPPA